MAQSLKTNQLSFIFDGSYRNTNDFGSDASKFLHSWTLALVNGTGALGANFAWSDQITINATLTSTVNLFALTDRFNNSIAPSIVKVFAVRLTSSGDTAATLNLGGSTGGNEWLSWLANSSDIVKVRYLGWNVAVCQDATGYAVSNTNKNILITNNSTTHSVVVDVVVVGVK